MNQAISSHNQQFIGRVHVVVNHCLRNYATNVIQQKHAISSNAIFCFISSLNITGSQLRHVCLINMASVLQANFAWEVQLPNGNWSSYSPEISGSLNNILEAGLRRVRSMLPAIAPREVS